MKETGNQAQCRKERWTHWQIQIIFIQRKQCQYQPHPFLGKILPPPPPPAFWENLANLTTPSQRGGRVVQSMIFADWRVQNWKLGSNIILINKKIPGSNNFLINEVQHFGSYQDFPRFVIFFSKASLTLSGLKHGHRSLEFTNCIRKPEKLLQINKDNNSIN